MTEQKETQPLSIEWRKVSGVVLVADVESFFPLCAKMSHDELGVFIQNLYSFWSTEIARRNGEVVAYIGDSVMATFFKESSSGMDPEWCATTTAFHIAKGAKKIAPDLEINVALTSGQFLSGRWEEQNRPMRAILGDVVNRAAMLVSSKNKGIFASKAVVDILGPRVKSEKFALRFPASPQDEPVFRLTSLVL